MPRTEQPQTSRHRAGSPGVLREIDAICNRFEDAFVDERPPLLEDFLFGFQAAHRPALLRELIGIELEVRRRRGETPLPREYAARFPDHGDLIRAVFDEEQECSGCNSPSTRLDGQRSQASFDLLLGMLALANGLIDRAALVVAFRDWTEDKARSVGRILVDRGLLGEGELADLVAMAERHVARHGGIRPGASNGSARSDRRGDGWERSRIPT